MVYFSDVREWVKTFGIFQGYWIGRLSTKRDNTLGIYPLRNSPARREVLTNSLKSYDVTGINFLIHGSNNKDETERLTWTFYNALSASRPAFLLNGKQVYFIRMLYDCPIDVGSEGDIFEYTIQIEIYSERIVIKK